MSNTERTHRTHGRPRTRSVARRIALLLAIPLTSLVALWGFGAATTLSAALQRRDFSEMVTRLANPAGAMLQMLQDERSAAVIARAARTDANVQRFQGKTAVTDAMVAAFQKSAHSPRAQAVVKEPVQQRLRDVDRSVAGLRALRARVLSGQATPVQLIDEYGVITDTTMRLLMTTVSVDDVTVYRQGNALAALSWAEDFMVRQSQLLSVARPGRLSAADRATFTGWAVAREQYIQLGLAGLQSDIARIVRQFTESRSYSAYRSLERSVVADGTVPDAQQWRSAIGTLTPQWMFLLQKAGDELEKRYVEPARQGIMLRFYLAAGVGLLGVIASVGLSLLFARRIAAELRALQRTAQELAHDRLPRVVARLRRGETVDVAAEAPPPGTGRTKEIALVTDAFAAVQRTAISSAVGEAELRASINRVFVNLSWRSQSLLHRQLRLLDQMERRASSPEELDDLFRLDHLTTRMRRHAEGLVILSGAPTVRAWDHPVPAEDLVRAAIAEVEDYTRVELTGASSSAVKGEVVADVIHLLAELIENATVFSPPNTEVTVKLETAANGLAVEVVDRGVGLPPDELAELNRRLSDTVEFDLGDTDRLGLFVVARLAARHGIKVTLTQSPYDGTTAIVLVPNTLVTLDAELHAVHGVAPTVPEPTAAVEPAATPGGPPRIRRPIRPALTRPASHVPPPRSAVVFDERPAPPGDDPPPPEGAVLFDGLPPRDRTAQHEGLPPRDQAASPQDGTALRHRSASPGGTVPRDRTAPPGGMAAAGQSAAGAAAEAEDSEITGVLPRRVRQQKLAPQLRERPAPRRPVAREQAPADDFEEPSPELSRDLMSSLQSGWQRSREDEAAGEDEPREGWGDHAGWH